jgi:hypothetical protein
MLKGRLRREALLDFARSTVGILVKMLPFGHPEVTEVALSRIVRQYCSMKLLFVMQLPSNKKRKRFVFDDRPPTRPPNWFPL